MKRGIPEESFLIFDKDGDIKKDSSGIPNLVKHNRGLPLRAAPQGGIALAPTHGYSDIRFLRNRRRNRYGSVGDRFRHTDIQGDVVCFWLLFGEGIPALGLDGDFGTVTGDEGGSQGGLCDVADDLYAGDFLDFLVGVEGDGE